MPLPDRKTKNLRNTLDNVRLLNKLFYDTPAYSSAAHHPRMNLWASDLKAVVHALAPGVDKKDIDIQIQGQTLFIRFNREPQLQEGSCKMQERWQNEYASSVQLPFPVNIDQVEARFNDGLLEIDLPRLSTDKVRKIPIRG